MSNAELRMPNLREPVFKIRKSAFEMPFIPAFSPLTCRKQRLSNRPVLIPPDFVNLIGKPKQDKMKHIYTLFFASLFVTGVSAQQIDSLVVSPANPTTTTPVTIYPYLTFPYAAFIAWVCFR
ncbi:MAG: hypothetical protein FD123_1523 [Bacteroidetes bacterium]|nr:MAG: hypothetical protein FD123_1523 [Bacteroidota bacterium]